MTAKPDNPGEKKKPYVKPEVRRVVLRPEEAVLASCKNTQTLGPGGFGQKCSGPPALCSHNAS